MLVAATLTAGPLPAVHSHNHATADTLGPGTRLQANGLYRVTLPDGHVITTHGPDPKSAMLGGHGTSLGPGDPERNPVCADDNYMHVLYGYPSLLQQSRLSSVVAEIRAHTRRMNAVLHEAAMESGGVSADYKVLCDESGEIQVDEFVTSPPVPEFSVIVASARRAGFTDPNVDYVIYYDGNFPAICGVAELRDDDRLSEDNRNNSGGYGVTYEDCWFSRTPMHENGHTQGAVQSGAPNEDGTGHCTEQFDIMCYPSSRRVCPDVQAFDCGYDTYFDAAPEPGEWLSDHWNLGSRLNRYIAFGDAETQKAPKPKKKRRPPKRR